MVSSASWKEEFLGGSLDAEQRQFREFARVIRRVQAKSHGKGKALARAVHAKMLAGTHGAVLEGAGEPEQGYFARGKTLDVTVRFSSASSRVQADSAHDLRGIALRMKTDHGFCDLLLTNAEISHIRNAAEFIHFTSALVYGETLGGALVLLRHPVRGLKILCTARTLSRRKPLSLARDTFYSRAPFLLCGVPVRYRLRALEQPAELEGTGSFFADLKARLARADVKYLLEAQPYLNEALTPLDDSSVAWQSEFHELATLTLKKQTLPDEHSATWREIDALRFDPWHTYPSMRPLGSLNRARRYVYKASQEERARVIQRAPSRLEERALNALELVFRVFNKALRWDRFGTRLGTLNLVGLRNQFRRENLYSTDDPAGARPLPLDAAVPQARTADGRFNDLVQPEAGARNARFGRNVPLSALRRESDAELRTPPPKQVSDDLLARKQFLAAPSVNLLAVAWVQFQIHDWFKHREVPPEHARKGTRKELAEELKVYPTLESKRGSSLDVHAVPAHENEVTHWWDCSQIYGNEQNAEQLRAHDGHGLPRAELALDRGFLPREQPSNVVITGNNQNWWIGLEVLHTLFAHEHNAICALLRSHHPGWSEQRLYETARLINVATIAKIHTVEWTPAVFGHPTLRRAMRAHWDGLFGRRWQKLDPPTTELRNGIPGSATDLFDVPFALTEEFASVYRLHPMLPDTIALHVADRQHDLAFKDVAFESSTQLAREHGLAALTHSLALGCAGQMRLHNYPAFLRQLPAKDGRKFDIDLAAVEIFRDRERSVPRYNAFRAQFGLPRVKDFADLQVDCTTRGTLRAIYGDIDRVDLLVGLLSETPPDGFAISDTAFRVFVGMASRRLKSDRFLTDDYRPEIYTREGLAWIEQATFKGVLQRHLPELHDALRGVREVFAPWT